MKNHEGTLQSVRGLALVVGALVAAGCTSDVVPAIDSTCGLDAETERSPGYPYDLALWNEEVAPLLARDCTQAGCHADAAPPAGRSGGLTVFGAVTACDRVKTFDQVRRKVDLVAPEKSRLLVAAQGGRLSADVPHPFDYGEVEGGQAALDLLTGFVERARATCVADGGCAPDRRDFFDLAAFEATIAPGLDAAGGGQGCAATAACHAPPDGQLGFSLPPSPQPGSAAMEAASRAVTSRVELDAEPTATLFYVRATTPHADGASTTVDDDTARAILVWIGEAIAARGDGEGCADPAQLDLGVFRDDILPILRGDVDLNGSGGIATGCTRSVCHGERRPGALLLDPDAPPEDQLANFACFVSLSSPSSSQVLLCPRKDARCSVQPHPGDRIFGNSAEDQNYQRVMSFLFSAVTDSTPLDFAFFARRINPMFEDEGAVAGATANLTCADTRSCHGIALATQRPAGGNLAILPGAGEDVDMLSVNFTEASAFLNFITPEQSSLFLYPTDLIADRDNPVATGIPHPGGAGFAPDSRFARDVLTFARGLRPDADGFQPSWLIAGDYPAFDLREVTLVDEEADRPRIFDRSRGRKLGGLWDALFSDAAEVDVGGFLRGEVGDGRIAHAVAYVFNTTPSELEVVVELSSINAAFLRLDDGDVIELAPGATLRSSVTVPSAPSAGASGGSRIWIKLFEAPGDGGMRFSVRLLRPNRDAPYADGELFLKLGPTGGI